MRRITIGVALLAAVAAAQAGETRQIVATPDADVTVDGVLDEAIWRHAPPTDPFLVVGSHHEAELQTTVRVVYDDSALYVAVEAEEPAMDAVRAPERERDHGEIWRDDGVEVFLTPAVGGTEYFHFIHNLAGSRYDARHGTADADIATGWNPSRTGRSLYSAARTAGPPRSRSRSRHWARRRPRAASCGG